MRLRTKEILEPLQLQHWVRAVENGKAPTIKNPETNEIVELPLPLARSDGDGLTFTLSSSGTASWILRYRHGGRARELTIGNYPDIGLALRCEDLTEHTNGIEILLRHSKTDQEKAGRTVFIPHANGERCPVKALALWRAVAGIDSGWLFRAVNRHDQISDTPLTGQSVALIVKGAAKRVGTDPNAVSGHSLRAGYCTQAAIVGLQPYQIREQTGHKSDATLARYIRPVAKRKIPSLL